MLNLAAKQNAAYVWPTVWTFGRSALLFGVLGG